MLTLLFDADMLVYRAAKTVEKPICWEKDLWTLTADAAEANAIVDDTVQLYSNRVLNHYNYKGPYEIIMCFSDDANNFRKKILPTYKLNRAATPKPLCYKGTKEWVKRNFTCCQMPNLEADDCMGILATKPETKAVLISGDKDFKTIPSCFYDFLRDSFYDISEEEAQYWFFYQTLIGDTADNYKGCPTFGPVKAKKVLDKSNSWSTVVEAFKSQELTEDDALTQARVARILHFSDYDFTEKRPILWKP